MISKINIIILSSTSLQDSQYKAECELATYLLKSTYVAKVLYVNSNYKIKDIFTTNNKVPLFKLLGLLPKYTYKNGLCTVYSQLNFNNLNYNKLKNTILKVNKKLNVDNLVVLNFSSPKMGLELSNQLNEIFTVYYRSNETDTDEYDLQYSLIAHNIINQSQSEQLNIDNNVKYELYHKYYKAKRFNRVKKLLIGYTGELNDNIDYNLLRYCIIQFPEAHFKFIGPIKSNKIYEFRTYINVEIINTNNIDKIAFETNTLHVGLLPFINIHEVTTIKTDIYNYFSAGLSVISNNLLNFNYFKNNVIIADDKIEFEAAIRKCATHLTSGKATIQTMSAKHVSWTAKVDEILKIIKNGIRQIH